MIYIQNIKRPDSFQISHLFGEIGGGMLEFVKMEEYEQIFNEGQIEPWVRLYFTNHDVQTIKNCIDDCPKNKQNELLEKQYFIIEAPKFR